MCKFFQDVKCDQKLFSQPQFSKLKRSRVNNAIGIRIRFHLETNFRTSVSGSMACRGLVMSGANAWLHVPYQILVLSRGEWWSLLPDIRGLWRHTFGEVVWHNIHIFLHALPLLVIHCVTATNNQLSALQVRRSEQKWKHSTQREDRAVHKCKSIWQCVKTGV